MAQQNPLLWFVCMFCKRAYKERGHLIEHKWNCHKEKFEAYRAQRRAERDAKKRTPPVAEKAKAPPATKGAPAEDDKGTKDDQVSTVFNLEEGPSDADARSARRSSKNAEISIADCSAENGQVIPEPVNRTTDTVSPLINIPTSHVNEDECKQVEATSALTSSQGAATVEPRVSSAITSAQPTPTQELRDASSSSAIKLTQQTSATAESGVASALKSTQQPPALEPEVSSAMKLAQLTAAVEPQVSSALKTQQTATVEPKLSSAQETTTVEPGVSSSQNVVLRSGASPELKLRITHDAASNTYTITPKSYKCPQCPRLFPTEAAARSHAFNVHRYAFKCQHCSQIFKTVAARNMHENNCHGGTTTQWKCPHCPLVFPNPRSRFLHAQHVHRQQVFPTAPTPNKIKAEIGQVHGQAKQTQTQSPGNGQLEQQQQNQGLKQLPPVPSTSIQIPAIKIEPTRAISNGKLNTEATLQKQQFGRGHFSAPMRAARGSQFKCTVCSQRFKSKKSLEIHAKNHNMTLPHKCYICQVSFPYKRNLARHNQCAHAEVAVKPEDSRSNITSSVFSVSRRPSYAGSCISRSSVRSYSSSTISKSNRGPFPCPHCEKVLFNPQLLEIHKRIHTWERPYRCQICRKAYSHEENLKQHMISHSSGERDQRTRLDYCHFCKRKYKSVRYAREHMWRVHGVVSTFGDGMTGGVVVKSERTNDAVSGTTMSVAGSQSGYGSSSRVGQKLVNGLVRYECLVCYLEFSHRVDAVQHVAESHNW